MCIANIKSPISPKMDYDMTTDNDAMMNMDISTVAHDSNMDTESSQTPPNNLTELLVEVEELRSANPSITGANALLNVIRKHHFWPALQVKKFFHDANLVLLHNTYKRVDVSHFKTLYDECRSVVLDMSAEHGHNVIVSFADQIPDRMVADQYASVVQPSDVCVECYEGTVVTVYNYKGKWYFGTSSCPSVNSSRFHHPTLTHGNMLDDALNRIFPCTDVEMGEDEAVRTRFTNILDPTKAYAFVLVHHMSRHTMNYESVFGEAEYAKLIHISTRDRASLFNEDISDAPFEKYGILYARTFAHPAEALHMVQSSTDTFGVLVTRENGQRLKVSHPRVVHKEECDLGSPNPWVNMLWLFLQNRPDYHVQQYQADFAPDVVSPVDGKGRPMTPTYLIYTCMCNMRDILFHLYSSTTTYYPSLRRFKMNKVMDNQYHSIVRFHLAQLRHVQVQHHTHAFLSKKAVYHYLCFHQTLKNIRALIKFFAENDGYFTGRPLECFRALNKMLESNPSSA